MISVIVPVYKSEKTIACCIESVLMQEYQDWELILVDDGSPDKSGEICEEYAQRDNRISVVHKKNEGASEARNTGINNAKGEYISFVDADDYLSPRYLLDFAQDPFCDFEIQGYTHAYPHSDCVTQSPAVTGSFSICEMFSFSSLWYLVKGPCCKLFRRSIIEDYNIRFPKGFSYGEDEIFVLGYLQHCSNNVYVHSVSNYFYTHENEESLTHRFIPGALLLATVVKQYHLMRAIDAQVHLPLSFINFYRKDRAIDFYQSIYNCIIDSSLGFFDCFKQIINADLELWTFVSVEKDLPKRFKVLREILVVLYKLR